MEEKGTMHVHLLTELTGNLYSEESEWEEDWSESDEYEEGMELLRELYAKAIQDQREDIPLSELRVGLKCGGSVENKGMELSITGKPIVTKDFQWETTLNLSGNRGRLGDFIDGIDTLDSRKDIQSFTTGTYSQVLLFHIATGF